MSEMMNAMRWLDHQVRAFYALDKETHARGKVIAYCEAPTVVIQTEEGECISWRADLCEEVAGERHGTS